MADNYNAIKSSSVQLFKNIFISLTKVPGWNLGPVGDFNKCWIHTSLILCLQNVAHAQRMFYPSDVAF